MHDHQWERRVLRPEGGAESAFCQLRGACGQLGGAAEGNGGAGREADGTRERRPERRGRPEGGAEVRGGLRLVPSAALRARDPGGFSLPAGETAQRGAAKANRPETRPSLTDTFKT